MMKIFLQTTDEDYVLRLDGDDEYLSTALQSLIACVPREFLSLTTGLRVRSEGSFYLDAWLKAVEATHRATTIVWLPVARTA